MAATDAMNAGSIQASGGSARCGAGNAREGCGRAAVLARVFRGFLFLLNSQLWESRRRWSAAAVTEPAQEKSNCPIPSTFVVSRNV